MKRSRIIIRQISYFLPRVSESGSRTTHFLIATQHLYWRNTWIESWPSHRLS